VLIDGDFAISPWIDPARLACRGAVLLWRTDLPARRRKLLARFPMARPQPDIALPVATWGRPETETVGWAILPPGAPCNEPGGKTG
jgi:hypothetical protein